MISEDKSQDSIEQDSQMFQLPVPVIPNFRNTSNVLANVADPGIGLQEESKNDDNQSDVNQVNVNVRQYSQPTFRKIDLNLLSAESNITAKKEITKNIEERA